MNKHTPGPWTTKRAHFRVDGEYDHAIVAEGQVIAEAFGRSGQSTFPPAEANARLITAAPDLLDALRSLIELGRKDTSNPKYDGYYESARAAIAKAEGK